MYRRRESTARRVLAIAGSIVVVFGLMTTGNPAVASVDRGAEVTPTPSASAPDPTTPAPNEPAPAPSEPDPAPSESVPAPNEPAPGPSEPTTSPADPAPKPSTPASIPTQPAPTIDPWMPAPPGLGGTSVDPPRAGPIPAPAFARFYPTNPWIFNARPGTRYLDARETTGDLVLRRHMGIDSQGGFRQPIFAVAAGVVVDGTWSTTYQDRHGFGNQVRIAHDDGYATRYAHFAEAPLVRAGERVTAGQLIGYMGGSQRGDLTGLARHLHFEVTKDGRNIDPIAFLSGASSTVGAPEPVVAAAASSALLHEISPGPDGDYVSTSTGITVNSSVFTAIDVDEDHAQVMASEDGRLTRIAAVDGAWTKTDTGLALDATSLSGVDSDNGYPELFAIEDGKLFHVVGDAAGWTKTWTGHYFSGTVSAVRLPGGQLHALLLQAGYLYHLHPAQGGLWDITDTGLRVEQVDAVSLSGSSPVAMGVIDGEVYRIARGEITWDAVPTGLPASGSLAATNEGAGWPVAISADPDGIGVTRVVDRMWTRYAYELTASGPIDAVVIGGVGTIVYSLG